MKGVIFMPITGYLIDPEAKTIAAVELSDTIDDIKRLIEAPLFDVVRLDLNDAIYVDDEGLYNKSDFFMLKNYPNPLAGRGLVLGTDSEGYSTDPIHDIMEIAELVKFIDYSEALRMAKVLDAEAEAAAREYEKQGMFGFVHIPITGILESNQYTEESD
jgi:hypothetical protein